MNRLRRRLIQSIFGLFGSVTLPVSAQTEFTLEIKNHLFFPETVHIPAQQRVRLVVINHDATAEEFESSSLSREKIIPGRSKTIILIGPLSPGHYSFFGEFNPTTAVGTIVAE